MNTNSWSKNLLPRESLRPFIGKRVNVLAVYGRNRQFIVGVNSAGELIEVTKETPEGFTESFYVTITEVKTKWLDFT